MINLEIFYYTHVLILNDDMTCMRRREWNFTYYPNEAVVEQ
jgi:hypothetical protein